jgi:hypothetical protein
MYGSSYIFRHYIIFSYQLSFLMDIVYLWYILSAKANCVSWISNLECTMFVVRYVLCHNTCKSWCALIVAVLCVLCIYWLHYVSVVYTMYLLFVLCIYCLYLTPDYFLLRCRTAGWKSVTGRFCDLPSRHRSFLVFLGPRVNAGLVPVFFSKLQLRASHVALS